MGSFMHLMFITLLLLVACSIINLAKCQLGVVYSPFVKLEDSPFSTKSYRMEDVKLMLDIIENDNFPLVTTYSVGAPDEPYQTNSTRYRCTSVVHTVIAAAEINKVKRELALSVYQGIDNNSSAQRLNSEIQVAFEMAQAANEIYDGTVSALIFPSVANVNELFDMVDTIKNVSVRARNMKLRFGVRIKNCETKIPKLDKKDKKNLELLSLYDFIICKIIPSESLLGEGVKLWAEDFFEVVIVKNILAVEQGINNIIGNNRTMQVILESGWATVFNESSHEEVLEMRRYWEHLGQWANANKRIVFMNEAFDNPWRDGEKDAPHYGLWTHLNKADVTKDAFVRKVNQIETHNIRKSRPMPPPKHGGSINVISKPEKSPAIENGVKHKVRTDAIGLVFLTLLCICY